MKSDSAIYIVPLAPVFNKEAVSTFEHMDKEHSCFLQSSLYMNNVEVVEKLKDHYKYFLCISRDDQQDIPSPLLSSALNVSLLDTGTTSAIFKQLNEKYFSNFSKNLVIFSRAIGLNAADMQKVFDLLAVEDDTVVIGRANNDSISFLGFTKYHPEIFINIDKPYDMFLPGICKQNYFLSVVEKSMYISKWNDFRNLYTELSKKESLSYCSQKMHEQFTHLFIEYKEQIK
jgi:hypothetical protein